MRDLVSELQGVMETLDDWDLLHLSEIVRAARGACSLYAESEARLLVENARLRGALNRLTGSMEGVDTPFTDEQEAAYEAAASLLDDLSPDPA